MPILLLHSGLPAVIAQMPRPETPAPGASDNMVYLRAPTRGCMFSALLAHYANAGPAADSSDGSESAEALLLERHPLSRLTLCSPVVAFTDGACTGNGSPDARAGYAAVFFGGVFGSSSKTAVADGVSTAAEINRSTLWAKGPPASCYFGAVAPRRYRFCDDADYSRGVEPATEEHVAATNNRAELLGIITALVAVLASGTAGPVEIVSDSNVSVRTLNEWLPNRRRAGTANSLQNMDLLRLAEALMQQIAKRPNGSLTLRHCEAHRAEPPRGPSHTEAGRRWLAWYGNNAADREAGRAVTAGSVTIATATGLDIFAVGPPGEGYELSAPTRSGEQAPARSGEQAAPTTPVPVPALSPEEVAAAEAALAELLLE